MLRVIRLEWIGMDSDCAAARYSRALGGDGRCRRRPWVREVTGTDHGFLLTFKPVRGQIDYSASNRAGSRGVFLHFFVEVGKVYEIFRNRSWGRTERVFIHADPNSETVLSEDEVFARFDTRRRAAS